MASGLGNLTYDITANSSTLDTSMATAVRKIQGHSANISSALGGIQSAFSLAEKAAALFGIGLGIHEFADFVERTAQAAQQLQSLAGTLGESTTALQEQRIAADEVGVSNETLQTGLDRLTRSVGEAADGNKVAIKAFNDLGVGVLDAGNRIRPNTAIIGDMATALSKIPEAAKRAALETAVMGRGAQLLDPFFRQGGDAIAAMGQKAQDLGLVIDNDTIVKLAKLNGKIDEMSKAWSVAGDKIVADAEPQIAILVEKWTEAAGLIAKAGDAIILANTDVANDRQLDVAKLQIAGIQEAIAKLKDEARGESLLTRVFFGANDDITALESKLSDLQALVARSTPLSSARPPQASITGAGLPASYDLGGPSHNPPPAGEDKAQKVIDDLKFEAEQIGRTAAQQKVFNDLKKAGVAADSAAGRQIQLFDEILQDHADALKASTVVDKLRFENDQLGRNSVTQKINNDLKQAGVTIDSDAGRQIQALDERYAALDESQKSYNADLEKAKQLHADLETPLEKYNDLLAEANRLRHEGALSSEDYDRQLKKAKEDLDKSNDSLKEFGLSMLRDIENAKSWGDVLTAVFNDVIAELIRLLEVKDSGGGGSGGKGANWLQDLLNVGISLLGSGGGGITGGSGSVGSSAGSPIPVHGFAAGGEFDVGGRGGIDSQLVMFMATPGEHVKVGGGNSQAAGHTYIYSPTIDARGLSGDAFGRSLHQNVALAGAHFRRVMQRDGRQ